MAATSSTALLPLGSPAPDFDLPDIDGSQVSLADHRGHPLLVTFICNHCPYVKHLNRSLVAFGREYLDRDLAIVAINSNDPGAYPEDSPQKMQEAAAQLEYPFPYLFDETQEVAKAYGVACTPEFFLFDANHQLAYHGQFDDSRPGSDKKVTGRDLRAATDAVLAGGTPPRPQIPSIGCSLKWRPGNEPNPTK
jgi:peroxiredoxin